MKKHFNWSELQNGSDIRGVALPLDPSLGVNFTPERAYLITLGFADWLKTQNPSKEDYRISVGIDSRLSGPALKQAVLNAVADTDNIGLDCDMASTPAMFMSCIYPETACDGAIMITASHLPSNRNGMKFFHKEGGLGKNDIAYILQKASEFEKDFFDSRQFADKSEKSDKILKTDLIGIYSNNLVEIIRKEANSSSNYEQPLAGLKIPLDAGNGAGGFFATQILQPLGADVSASRFLDPDGNFPNHIPNPEDQEAMESISEAVLESKADFGIIFDTDVDRAGAVDKKGNPINRNRLIALISAILLEENPGTTIVTDSITSNELADFIGKKLGGIHHRFKRGYKNVIDEAIRLNQDGQETHLAIETSGHAALKENYFLDDGAYLIAKFLIEIARLKEKNKTIDMLIEDLSEPMEADEFRLPIKTDDFKTYAENVMSALESYTEKKQGWQLVSPNFEGVRVNVSKGQGDGWFLLRMSLHEPLMPLNIEANEAGGVKKIANDLLEFLKEHKELDTQVMEHL